MGLVCPSLVRAHLSRAVKPIPVRPRHPSPTLCPLRRVTASQGQGQADLRVALSSLPVLCPHLAAGHATPFKPSLSPDLIGGDVHTRFPISWSICVFAERRAEPAVPRPSHRCWQPSACLDTRHLQHHTEGVRTLIRPHRAPHGRAVSRTPCGGPLACAWPPPTSLLGILRRERKP